MTTAREVVSAWLKEPSDLPFGCDEVVDEIFATLAAAGYHLCREGEVPPWMEPVPLGIVSWHNKPHYRVVPPAPSEPAGDPEEVQP